MNGSPQRVPARGHTARLGLPFSPISADHRDPGPDD
jgi:hypothetical protein